MSDESRSGAVPQWRFSLYIMGTQAHSVTALRNIELLAERLPHLKGTVEIVDLERVPHRAKTDQILATPTLVRHTPSPECRLIGNLSDHERLITEFDLC